MARRKKTKVFVSYSRHDEALVKPLAGLLGVAAEDAVFLDVEQLKPGDLWEEKLVNAVKESSVFVLCWCCQSEKSEYVAKEISTALTDSNKKLVPVLFCSTKLPVELATRQWIDLRGRIVHACEHEPAPKGKQSGTKQSGRSHTSEFSSSWSREKASAAARSRARAEEASAPVADSSRTTSSRQREQMRQAYMGRRNASNENPASPYSRSASPYPQSAAPSSLPTKLIVWLVLALFAYGVFLLATFAWRHRQFIGVAAPWLGAVIVALVLGLASVRWYRRFSKARVLRDQKRINDVANRARTYFEGLRQN